MNIPAGNGECAGDDAGSGLVDYSRFRAPSGCFPKLERDLGFFCCFHQPFNQRLVDNDRAVHKRDRRSLPKAGRLLVFFCGGYISGGSSFKD